MHQRKQAVYRVRRLYVEEMRQCGDCGTMRYPTNYRTRTRDGVVPPVGG